MAKHYDPSETARAAGEQAAQRMSAKAREYYYGSDIKLWAYNAPGGGEYFNFGTEYDKIQAGNRYLSFDAVQAAFERLQDEKETAEAETSTDDTGDGRITLCDPIPVIDWSRYSEDFTGAR